MKSPAGHHHPQIRLMTASSSTQHVTGAANSDHDLNHNPMRTGVDASTSPSTANKLQVATRVASKDNAGNTQSERPFSIYTKKEKWVIVIVGSFAGVFSPLTANIYFPAIPTIANAFGKTVEAINLTVTVYMLMQGVTPMAWGTLADRVGRRPIFLACLLLLALSCVGLALVPTGDYWLLMLLRCIQAAGSASTIALGAGVVGDISTPAERGGFMGVMSAGPMIGPALGPVFGGVLTDKLGWRSIFWFLTIGSMLCFLVLFLFLPETLRSLVGDGSITPSVMYRAVIPVIGRSSRLRNVSTERPPPKVHKNPLRMFLYPDVVLILVFNGVLYAVFYAVSATISSLFAETYPYLTETALGLSYLSIGGGMVVGSLIVGRLLDMDYQIVKRGLIRKLEAQNAQNIESGTVSQNIVRPEDVTKESVFPIEKARLRTMPVYLVLFCACCFGYGWMIEQKVSIAGPLVLQFILGFTVTAVMNTTSTVLVDIAPSEGSSITACNNIVRCSLGATSVSVIDIMISALGVGWSYTVLGFLCVAVGPLLWAEMRYGPRFRKRRQERAARKKQEH